MVVSCRQYAKHRGVTPMAVSQAIKDGRLLKSVIRVDGQPKIADVALADREWAQNTDYTDAPGRSVPVLTTFEHGESIVPVPALAPAVNPDERSQAEAMRREKWAKAEMAELELQEKAGTLVEKEKIVSDFATQVTAVRNKLLGVPSRVKQQRPELELAVVDLVDKLIREALEDTADDNADES